MTEENLTPIKDENESALWERLLFLANSVNLPDTASSDLQHEHTGLLWRTMAFVRSFKPQSSEGTNGDTYTTGTWGNDNS